MAKKTVLILEGSWWNKLETPQILPYFQAYVATHPHSKIELLHRTIRNVEDIAHYVSKIPTDSEAFLYVACHGNKLALTPEDGRKKIARPALLDALSTDNQKGAAISFIHFGCCEMVDPHRRRQDHEEIMDRTGATWVSGYTQSVNWLPSTFLDLALVDGLFTAHTAGLKKIQKKAAADFIQQYDQHARHMGFSGLGRSGKEKVLFPERLSRKERSD